MANTTATRLLGLLLCTQLLVVFAAVTFESSTMDVKEQDGSVLITLRRSDADAAEQMAYTTLQGSATATSSVSGPMLFHWYSVQELQTEGAEDWAAFTFRNVQYLAVANSRSSLKIFRHDGAQLRLLQQLSTGLIRDWEAFQIDDQQYLAMANFKGPDPALWSTLSTVYRFNENTGRFIPFQQIPTQGAINCEYFMHRAVHYLVYANYNDDRKNTAINSAVYVWLGGTFVLTQLIPTLGAFDVEAFLVGGTPYLAFANYFDSTSNSFEVESTIWAMDSNGAFVLQQSIASQAAADWQAFQLDGRPHLVLANHRSDQGYDNVESRLYRWDVSSQTFLQSQSFSSRGAYDWEYFVLQDQPFLALAMAGDASTAFEALSPIFRLDSKSSLFLYETAIPSFGARGFESFQLADGSLFLALANFGSLASNNQATQSKIIRAVLAAPGVDFVPVTAGLVTFAAGELSQTFVLGLIDDALPESSEQFSVEVSAGDGTVLTASISIADNDIAIFSADTHTMSVLENQDSGATVLPALTFTKPSPSTTLRFFLLGDSTTFVVHASTGAITTLVPLDREVTPLVQFSVLVNSSEHSGLFDRVVVTVVVDDINDNHPLLVASTLSHFVSEGLPVGSVFGRVAAFDPDSGNNARLQFSFSVANSLFRLNASSGELSTKQVFDFETAATLSYSFQITVQDSGSVPLSARGFLQLVIRDINDNAPLIARPVPVLVLPENRVVPSMVFTVVATDADERANAVLTFSLVAGNEGQLFSINALSGQISLVRPLDFEDRQQHILTVRVQDSGSPKLSDVVNVTFNVANVNDNGPVFSEDLYRTNVSESAAVGTVVTRLVATDADGNGLDTRYTMTSQPFFHIDASTGQVLVVAPLDYDTQPPTESFVLTVTATDMTSNVSSMVTLKIILLDENDMSPVFSMWSYNVTMREDADNAFVVQLHATDGDSGLNGELTYAILDAKPASATLYAIDAIDGTITTVGAIFNRELTQRYTLDVQVIDAGTPSRSATATVIITVLDVNDHPPFFDKATDTLLLSEAQPFPASVYSLAARDEDVTSEFNTLTFHITAGNGDGVFAIVDNTLRLVAALDRETTSSYFLSVQVTDGTSSDVLALTITVQDVNDNAPVLRAQTNVSLAENMPVNSVVALMRASDADAGRNKDLRFSLDGAQSDFAIDDFTGVVTTLRLFDFEAAPDRQHRLIVVVSDNGQTPLSSKLAFSVLVTDVNDNKPTFIASTPQSLVVDEHASGQLLALVAADADSGAFGKVSYTLTSFQPLSGAQIFSIDSDTGSLTVSDTAGLDREKASSFTFSILARDPDHTVSHDLVINLNDINDHEPVFDPRVYDVVMREEAKIGTVVTTVLWADDDATSSMRASLLNITAGDPDSQFSLLANGELRTSKLFASANSFELTIGVQNTAPDSSGGVAKSDATVRVTLDPRNRNAPKFPRANYSAVVSEGDDEGVLVLLLDATDADQGLDAEIVYAIESGNVGTAFRLLADGSVVVARKLDRETLPSYSLVISATDQGRPPLSSSIQLSISVSDINDSPPIFLQATYMATINESLLPGRPFLQVQSSDLDEGENAKPRYLIFASQAELEALPFVVDEFSGEISVKSGASIDVDKGGPTVYDFVVIALSGTLSDATNVVVRVQDVNDNAPVFAAKKVALQVTENLSLGQTIATVVAQDVDSGLNGQITYSLGSSNMSSVFSVDVSSGVISVLQTLDYEQETSYVFTVVARDGGGLSTMLHVQVNVLDVNDNAPLFPRQAYDFFVDENSPPGTPVQSPAGTGLVATDVDAPNTGNSQVTYAFVQPQTAFYIDAKTGDISTRLLLDREIVALYTLTVRASDNPINVADQLSTTVTVHIYVNDLNDNAPQAQDTTVTVVEDVAVGSSVTLLTAFDADASSASLTYAFVEQQSTFSLMPNGTVTTLQTLDRETVASYNLAVRVSDNDANPTQLERQFTLTIVVADVNDNSPQFSATSYKTSLTEEQPPTVLPIDLGVTDADADQNARISYFIRSGAEGRFEIGRSNGILVADSLDREAAPSYTLLVEAVDNGIPSRSAKATVEVTVLDINDQAPVFVPVGASVNVAENATVGSYVVQLEAVDTDAGMNAVVVYELLSAAAVFQLNATSGRLTTRVSLDREATPEGYTVVVGARDQGDPWKQTNITFQVLLLDVNDNPPVFLQSTYVAAIDEHSAVGSFVTQVAAVSLDQGQNAVVSYSLESPYFGIDAEGVISVMADIDRELLSSHLLVTVQARDGGIPPLFGSTLVTIYINDINDNAPVLQGQPSLLSLPENVPVGRLIEVFTASDADSQTELLFSLQASSEYFSIGNATGELFVKAALDFEKLFLHVLTIQVTDGDFVDEATVTITVQDVNDNAPVVQLDFQVNQLFEDAAAGTLVTQLIATDADFLAPNVDLSFAIIEGNALDAFAIDLSGRLTVAGQLDRERQESYQLLVEVSDDGRPRLTTRVTVVVPVLDVNDNAPVVSSMAADLIGRLPENTALGATILTVIAQDADANDNGRVAFSLVNGDLDALLIEQTSGVVTNALEFDYERQAQYWATVRVTDQASPFNSVLANITVHVLDVNDNAPAFTERMYSLEVREDEDLSQTLLTLLVQDNDTLVENKDVLFMLVAQEPADVQPHFVISAATGELRLGMSLDYEQQQQFTLWVQANNTNNMALFAQTTVAVTVVDVNDNRPVFRNVESLHVSIGENRLIQNLTQVYAADADADANTNLTYSIVATRPPEMLTSFTIDKTSGIISIVAPLDREETAVVELSLQASDNHGDPRALLSTVERLTVTVEDSNDNAPFFLQPVYNSSVLEGAQAGEVVLRLEAQDKDVGLNAELVFELQGAHGAAFEVIPRTQPGQVEILTRQPLNREVQSRFEFKIVAKDQKGANGHLQGMATVVVHVLDVNDNGPSFLNESIKMVLSEAVESGTLVAKVLATDPDWKDNGQVVYRIVAGNTGQSFDMDAASGRLTVRRQLDFEEIQEYNLTVAALDVPTAAGQGASMPVALLEVSILVTDVNDNAPIFQLDLYAFGIDEGLLVGTLVGSVAASDADSGLNQELNFTIVTLEGSSRLDGAAFSVDSLGRIYTQSILDREAQKVYHFMVQATDGGSPSLKSITNVTVQVADVNDNAPVFGAAASNASLSELALPGTVVLQVQAQDMDAGDNARVSYRLEPASGPFEIDTESGVILIKNSAQLNYEMATSHVVSVIASDFGKPPQSGVMTVTVNLLDENDNAPVFPADASTLQVPELVSVGSTLFVFTTTDEDTLAVHTAVNYSLLAVLGGEPGTFAVHPDGRLELLLGLNLTMVDSYRLLVRASNYDLLTELEVTLAITDENDHSPVFESGEFEALLTIREDAAVGTQLYQLRAQDKDRGRNGVVQYFTTSTWLSVNSVSGIVTLVDNVFDAERQLTIIVLFSAKDTATLPRSSSFRLIISVENVNDVAPVFVGGPFSVTVPEDAAINSTAMVFNVTDADQLEDTKLVVSIVEGNANQEWQIDNTQAAGPVLLVVKSLDRETKATYRLRVRVSDGELSSEATVNIKLADVNDVSPTFAKAKYIRAVEENEIDFLEQFLVSDADLASTSGALTFSIDAGPFANSFRFISGTGVLEATRELDAEVARSFELTLRVTDTGPPALSSTAILVIQVADNNDNVPVFSQDGFEATVSEDADVGSAVLTVRASDDDIGDNAELIFRFLTPVPALVIEALTGTIFVNQPLDREVQSKYDLIVMVTDGGGLQNFTDVFIEVLDVNDNNPRFLFPIYTQSIMENLRQPLTVASTVATDPDEGLNGSEGLEYSILPGPGSHYFAVLDPSVGVVTTVGPIDFETFETINLVVQARDSGSPRRTGTTQVVVTVVDVNDNRPQFSQAQYQFAVPEAASPTEYVGQVAAEDRDSGDNSLLVFSLAGSNSKFFTIHPQTGLLLAATTFDREVQAEYVFQVLASDQGGNLLFAGLSNITTITVTILDVNDNVPQFTQRTYEHTLSEDIAVGEIAFDRLDATDADQGNNGLLQYTLAGGNIGNAFSIDAKTGVIYVAQPLDRESLATYSLLVKATDSGTPDNLFNESTVIITLSDVNDNAPVFIGQPPFVVNVSEGASVGDFVLALDSKDADTVSATTYTLMDNGSMPLPFAIHPVEGVIRVISALDRESVTRYSVFVMASDLDGLNTTAEVSISVMDINDNAPVFANAPASIHLEEEQGHLHFLELGASDADEGTNGEKGIVYSLLTTPGSHLFELEATDHNTFLLSVLPAGIDRESFSNVSLSIQAVDALGEGLSAELTIIIEIDDINDNSPIPLRAAYSMEVAENRQPGYFGLQLRAGDADAGDNAALTFFLATSATSAVRKAFLVELNTGRLLTRQSLDREEQADYAFNVTVSDQGPVPRTADIIVHVTITDENDNTPKFDQTMYNAQLPEDYAVDGSDGFLKVSASDKDIGLNAQLTFSIVAGNVGGYFSVNPRSGLVSLQQSLDRELVAQYVLTLLVEDQSPGALLRRNSSTTLVLDVTDVNDNAPQLQRNLELVQLSEAARPPQQLLTVNASDADEGNNAILMYFFVQDYAHFRIDKDFGHIWLAQALDRETAKEHWLEVNVSDTGTPSLSTVLRVHIVVLDVNDNAPVFGQLFYEASVNEDVAADDLLLNVTATDADLGENATITYSITSGDEANVFFINASSGFLYVRALDFERTRSYVLELTASNLDAVPMLTASVSVRITVLDINDNAPTFGQKSFNVSISEFAPLGTSLLQMIATDRDTGRNAKVTYAITDGNIDGLFQVLADSGTVKTAGRLDRESQAIHNLTITATDAGDPDMGGQLSGQTVLIVSVLDENDHPPQFLQNFYQGNISENAAQGKAVLQVSARDRDLGASGAFSYAIVSGDNSGRFDIHPNSGLITTRDNLDFESRNTYTLLIRAQDQGPNPQQGFTEVRIDVVDVNDNAPIFKSSAFVEVSEDAVVGKELYRTLSTDADSLPENTIVAYSFAATGTSMSADGTFLLNRSTGLLSLAAGLDRETRAFHSLFITATNPEAELPQASVLELRVQILDVNDNAPMLSADEYIVTVLEDRAVNEVVLAPKANDRDEGLNAQLLFALEGEGHLGLFSINATTGVIRIAGALDREVQANHTFFLTVTDKGAAPLSSRAPVTVLIADVNDENPIFPPDGYRVRVFEDIAVGASLVTVEALDFDLVENDLRYRILAGNTDARFAVDAVSGAVTVNQPLDFELKEQYSLSIEARDEGNRTAVTMVTILVVDVNDNSPRFEEQVYNTSIQENFLREIILLQVSATDKDSGSFGTAGLSYMLVPGPYSTHFDIDGRLGTLRAIRPLDFELVQLVSLTVVAEDFGQRRLNGTATVHISVLDVNDHSPVFSRSSYQAVVSEGSRVGALVPVSIAATDRDSADFGTIRYTLTEGANNLFTIDERDAAVRLIGTLDREQQDLYMLTIAATDGGNRQAVVTLRLDVSDINDNAPVVPESLDLNPSVLENITVGTVVFTAKASDADAGPNGELTFLLESESREGTVAVNETTGEVTTLVPLDREVMSSFVFQIKVRDNGRNTQRRSVQVFARQRRTLCEDACEALGSLAQCNSNAKCIVDMQRNICRARGCQDNMDEAACVGSSDRCDWLDLDGVNKACVDEGQLFPCLQILSGQTACEEGSENRCTFDQDTLSCHDGAIPCGMLFDSSACASNPKCVFEENQCRETTNCSETATTLSTIDVLTTTAAPVTLDPNCELEDACNAVGSQGACSEDVDCQYDFQSNICRSKVCNDLLEDNCASFTALECQWVMGEFSFFQCEPQDGAVPCRFIFGGVDSCVNGTNGRCEYDLSNNVCLDKGGHAPCGFFTLETCPAGVCRLAADPLGSEACVEVPKVKCHSTSTDIQVGITSNRTPVPTSNAIAASSTTAPIQTTKLAMPRTETVTLEVRSTSAGVGLTTEGLTTEFRSSVPQPLCSVINSETQCMEQTPRCLWLAASSLCVIRVADEVSTVDSFSNAPLPTTTAATGEDNNENNCFLFGNCSTTNLPPQPVPSCPGLCTTIRVVLTILDVNDNAPLFMGTPYQISILENVAVGTEIFKVNASDADSGSNALISYFAGQASSQFAVDPQTGAVRVTAALDRETTPVLFFVVVARDFGSPALGKATTIEITLLDVNDNAPVFQRVSTITLREDTPPRTKIFDVLATDDDLGAFGTVSYLLTKGNLEGKFSLNSSTGRLDLVEQLDREKFDSYNLVVLARDGGLPIPQVALLEITIAVADVNDNAPVFTELAYRMAVPEGQTLPYLIGQVAASDADLGLAGQVEFRLGAGPFASYFAINQKTGTVVTTKALDYEQVQTVDVTIEARDRGIPSQSAAVVVTVAVLDINDNSPAFLQGQYVASVSEHIDLNATVLHLEASDADAQGKDPLTFALVAGGRNHFAINNHTGRIYTISALDREENELYVLQVSVQDAGGRVGLAEVIVQVLDRNDHAPVFEQANYEENFAENMSPGSLVLQVKASDRDLGLNAAIQYSIVEQQADFTIDANNGSLFSARMYDYEQEEIFVLTVAAQDQGADSTQLSTTVTVVVHVTDVNDNSPVFVDSQVVGVVFNLENGEAKYTVSALSDSTACAPFEICTVGLPVLQLVATDADSADNAKLLYALAVPSVFFAVDATSGQLQTTAQLDRELTASHVLHVLVVDQGSPTRQARATVVIHVADMNDNTPQFSGSVPSKLFVAENVAAGTELHLFSASDPDVGSNAEVVFSISAGNADNKFSMEPNSGLLTVQGVLDYEKEPSVQLTLAVSNPELPLRSSSIDVTVHLEDRNDNKPVFASGSSLSVRVSSAAPTFTPLYFAVAHDDDVTAANSDMSYAISSVSPSAGLGLFAVLQHPNFGLVTPSGEPRLVTLQKDLAEIVLERSATYEIQLTASNTLATLDGQSGLATQKVEVVPFVQVLEDKSRVKLNWQVPEPCAGVADGFSIHCSPQRERRTSYTYEVWVRRSIGCEVDQCPSKVVSDINPNVCECMLYGAATDNFDAATDSLVFDLVTGSSYEFQLRQLQDGVVAQRSRFVGHTAQDYGIHNVRITPSLINKLAVAVTWDPPAAMNGGTFVTYKICYCSALDVAQADCSCNNPKAVEHVVVEVDSSTANPRKELGVPGSQRFWFVVELVAALSDGSIVVTRSDAVLQAVDSESSASSDKLGSGGTAGAAIAGTALLFVLVLAVVVLVRRQRDKGRVQPRKRAKAAYELKEDGSADSVAIALMPLKKKIFEDSMEHLNEVGTSTTDEEPGYWDYFSQERAQLFWPEADPARSMYDDVAFSGSGDIGSPLGSHERTRSFGLRSPHVLGDDIADTLIPQPKDRSAGFAQEQEQLRVGGQDSLLAAFNGNLRTKSTINTGDLPKMVPLLTSDGTLDTEFSVIKQRAVGNDFNFKAAKETYNVRKNRYANVLPLDDTRVRLEHNGILGSDYINANYVDGWRHPKRYIATQGPIPGTIHDFWRMIWEQNCSVIVMTTREVEQGKLKCHKYWPDEAGTIQCGSLEVVFQSFDDSNQEFDVRTMILQNPTQRTSREVTQYIYSHWPDQGVPSRDLGSVVHLLQEVRRTAEANTIQLGLGGPIVIHCSAGIGRTGTFAAIDIAMQRMHAIGNVDIPVTIEHLRMQRAGSVQTLAQYRFIYEAACFYANQQLGMGVSRPPMLRQPEPELSLTTASMASVAPGLTMDERQMLEKLAGPDNGMSLLDLAAALDNHV